MINTTCDENLDFSFKNSLLFYTVLKMLIQCQISENKLIVLQNQITSPKLKDFNDFKEFKKFLLLSEDVVKFSVAKRPDYETFVNTINEENLQQWKEFCDLSIDLILIKDLILAESKAYINDQIRNSNNEISDKLSMKYDLSNLQIPYGLRVAASLFSYTILDDARDKTFLLSRTNKKIDVINSKVVSLRDKYHITANNVYSLIIGESVNQSIKSDAGSSYESRFHESILPIVDSVDGHSHDTNIPSVEYDFTFKINKIKVGASVKRTLRERYKQNFEEISSLTVDYMVLVTLGTDLNEDKLNNILQREKIYVIVSQEIYESKEFLRKSPRVIGSNNISKELFKSIFK